MNKYNLEELKIRLAEFRKEWCRSQKNDKDILMFAHMCHVLDVHPELALTPSEILKERKRMSNNAMKVWFFAIGVIGFILLTITLRMEVKWTHSYGHKEEKTIEEKQYEV